jgi:hypothetical protein
LEKVGRPVDLNNSLLDRPIEDMSAANEALARAAEILGGE